MYPDQTITDNFRIVGKLDSKEDAEGNCYDWYEIDRHYRVVDKTGPLVQQAKESSIAMEDAVCELDAATEARLADIEAAICELDTIVNGGNS